MRSLVAFALLALTRVRAQDTERIFVDGKGIPNLAASTGSSTTITQLIQAALLGSGSILSQFANSPNNYQNADANTFSIKPATPPMSSSPPPPPRPATQAPAPAPQQEITLTGFTVPELSSSTSSVPSMAAPSTSTAATTTTTTTTVSATTATTTTVAPRTPTAALSTTISTNVAPSTAPTTTLTTTVIPTTTMTTTAAPTTATTTATTLQTCLKTSAAPTTTTMIKATSTITTTSTTLPVTSTKPTTAPTRTTETMAALTTITTSTPVPTTTTTIASTSMASTASKTTAASVKENSQVTLTTTPATTTSEGATTTATQDATSALATTSGTSSETDGVGSSVSLASPELRSEDMAVLETNADNGSGLTNPAHFTPEPDREDLESSPSSNEKALGEASVITAAVNDRSPSSMPSPMSQKSGPNSTPKKPIIVSATGSITSAAVFASNGSAVVSAAVNNNLDKEMETVPIKVTPAPEEDNESSYETSSTEEGAIASPESEVESEISKPFIPKGPGRLSEIPFPTQDAPELVDTDSVDSTTPGDPKILTNGGPQELLRDESKENAASPEADATILLETSSEPQVPITPPFGLIQDLLLSAEERATPEPSKEPSHSTEAIPFAALADSISSSFGNHGKIGPVPIPSAEVEIGEGGLDIFDELIPTQTPFDIGDFLNSMEEDIGASDEPDISAEPEMSGEPEMPNEPEASEEEILPSDEMEILGADLIVKHRVLLEPNVIAENIRRISDKITIPLQWTEFGLFLVSNLSKFGSAIPVVRQAEEIGTFELNLQSTCLDPSGCESEMTAYNNFVRDGGMDESLRARDMDRVNVYLKGELTEKSTPAGIDGTASVGLNGGMIAGIAIGAVAAVSFLIYGILLVARRGHRDNSGYDAEQGGIDSYNGPDVGSQTRNTGEEEGSFIISNFGGSPRNTEALIPWMSNSSSEGSASDEQESSSSFITVDTAGTEEIATNNLSNYRFEESTCSGSESEFSDLDVEDDPVR